ncbi:hypothetical protein GPECTOR_44g34 [Gonium pectorale]|uniref:Uncharacterized protein n=1 Tax=Gonium pectorale TaxID=33097 RepID=A0A150G922_GONPE|nr:hypothetical protein GPECTOR_44g34 [Gonium pectorale]|eukprot:KXZ46356.1 hypothetical protein GPECTOR_44g34 [Gonium pectorale]
MIAPLTAAVCSSSLIAATAAGFGGAGAAAAAGSLGSLGSLGSGAGGQGDDSTGRGSGATAAASSGSAGSDGTGLCGALAGIALAGEESRRDGGGAGGGGGSGGTQQREQEDEVLVDTPFGRGRSSVGALSGPLSASPRAPYDASLSRAHGASAAAAGAAGAGVDVSSLIAAAASAATAATLSLPGLLGAAAAGPTAIGTSTASLSVTPAGGATLDTGVTLTALAEITVPPLALPALPMAASRGAPPAGPDTPGASRHSSTVPEAMAVLGDALVFPTLAPPATAEAASGVPTLLGVAVGGPAPGAAAAGRGARAAAAPRITSWPFAAESQPFAAAMLHAAALPDGRGSSDGSAASSAASGGIDVDCARGHDADGVLNPPLHTHSASGYSPDSPRGGAPTSGAANGGAAAQYEGTMRGGCRRGTRALLRLDSAPAGSLLSRSSEGGVPFHFGRDPREPRDRR